MKDTGEEKSSDFPAAALTVYLTTCVGSLLSVALFGCNFSIGIFLAIIAFTRFKNQTQGVPSFSYYNPLRNDLAYCQGYVRLVNGITSVDNIYSSPQGGLHIDQQLIFIQSGNNIFLYY